MVYCRNCPLRDECGVDRTPDPKKEIKGYYILEDEDKKCQCPLYQLLKK